MALVESATEPNDYLNQKATGSVFARFKVEGVEANVASAFASLGLDPDPTARIAARVTLRFAVDRGGMATLEKATSAVEVREGSAEVVEGALRVTETETEIRGGTRLAELGRTARAPLVAFARRGSRRRGRRGERWATRSHARPASVRWRGRRASPGTSARTLDEEASLAIRLAEKALGPADDARAPRAAVRRFDHPGHQRVRRGAGSRRRAGCRAVDAADAFFERVEDEDEREEPN